MELFYRRPSIKARKAMSNAALNLRHIPGGRHKEVASAEESVKKFTGHEQVKIVNSGNSAILSVMSSFQGPNHDPRPGGLGRIQENGRIRWP